MILLACTLLSALVVLIKGLFFTINSMGRTTCHPVRIAWLAMTTGAFGVLIAPIYGRLHTPTVWEAALMIGLAVYVLFERRRPGHLRGAR